MLEGRQYLLVNTAVLPEVFVRVIEAKQLLAQGAAKSLSEAAEMVGISRSSFYKYKDNVFAHQSAMAPQIATLSVELMDRAGVLSALLAALSAASANILTINQNIPVDGVAPVSISMRTDRMVCTPEEVVAQLQQLEGVVNVRLLSSG